MGGMIQAAENTMSLMNDYYSWEKEYDAYQRMNNRRIMNAIEILMRTRNLSPAIARERVRSLITVYEDRFIHERDLLYRGVINSHAPAKHVISPDTQSATRTARKVHRKDILSTTIIA